MSFALAGLIPLIAAATFSVGRADSASAASRTATVLMKVDGKARRFTVAAPVRDVRPRGILLGLHPGERRQNGREMDRQVGLTERGTDRGWVVVLPDAIGGQFHAGDCCSGRPSRTDDLRFIEAATTYARRRYRAYRGPVVATGFSTGGFMAYRLACQTRSVTAIVVVAGLDLTGERCRPRRPVSVLHIHAKDDPKVPYAGGYVVGKRRLGVQALARFWARRGHCDELRQTNQNSVETVRARGCRNGVRVQTITSRSGGHTWPGAEGDYGPGSTAVDATETALDFFDR